MAYNCFLGERAVFRLEGLTPVELKQQVSHTVIKEVVKPVTVIKEVPVPVYKEITVLQEVIKEVPVEVIKEVTKVETKVVVDNKSINKLKSHVTKLEKSLSDANDKLKIKSKELDQEQSSAKKSIRELQSQASKLEKTLEKANAKLKDKSREITQKQIEDLKSIGTLKSQISKLQVELKDANTKLKSKPKTVEVIKEVIKEVPIEIIKEVEVVKSLDMATLQKMVAKMGTVQVSKKVVGESRTRGEGKIVSRKEIKPGTSKSVVTGKATNVTSTTSSKTSSVKSSTSKSGNKSTKGDDLTKIEGVGPAIAKLLNGAKIYTFKELSATKISSLQAILTEAGPKFQMHSPGSWPKQASLAAEGRWDDLKKLQDVLSGGK